MLSGNINKVIFVNFCQRFHFYVHAMALLLLARGLTLVQISMIESIMIFTIFVMEAPTGSLWPIASGASGRSSSPLSC